jgi:hypothetical protein
MAVNPPFFNKADADKIAGGWPDNVAKVIVLAWTKKGFKEDLLTYPLHAGETDAQARARTKKKLFDNKIDVQKPVVLAAEAFKTYQPHKDEVVLILPEPIGAGKALRDAKEVMLLHCLGV